MNVLIVEDEQYIREGIAGLLEWEKYGITGVYMASNGEKGLIKAKRLRPDVVISDIRMPRMTGISMAEELLKADPDCCVILLSAYSDIEYYRAAIKLRILDFLAKPVRKEELGLAVERAVKERRLRLEQTQMRRQFQRNRKNILVAGMIVPNRTDTVRQGFQELQSQGILREKIYITTAMVRFQKFSREGIRMAERRFQEEVTPCVEGMKMELLWMGKDENYIILEFLGDKKDLSLTDRRYLSSRVADALGLLGLGYIAWGNTVRGLERAFESYQTAAWQMQQCFFETYGAVHLYGTAQDNTVVEKYQSQRERIVSSIEEMEQERMLEEEKELYCCLKQKKNAYIQNVRNIYFRFFYTLYRQAELFHLNLEEGGNILPEAQWKTQTESFNLDELHGYFLLLAEGIFHLREQQTQEQPAIAAIKSYIEENYANPLLSLKEISDYVHISTSRLCTIFKRDTGATINQYLTEIRMEKARKYLKNSRYNVVDICQMTGYKDSSYFGKIFRRYFNMSPLEYREQWMSR